MADRTITTEFIGKDKSLSSAMDGASKKASMFQKVLGSTGNILKGALAGGAAVAGVGLAAVGGFLVQGVKDAASYQRVLAKTAAVIKSTGGAANVSAASVKGMAAQLESMSGVDEELIINSQNVLLTFTQIKNVGKDRIFDMATKSALDMSVALGSSLQGASIQVGKALNDPIKGITALSKVGVTFSAGQKKVIADLVKTGDVAGAQKVILAELNKEFGGQAKAAGAGFEGAMARAKDAVADTGREIGIMLLPKLTEAGEWLAQKIPKAVNDFKEGWTGIGSGASTDIGQLADSLRGLSEQLGGLNDQLGESKQNGFVQFAKATVGAMTTMSDGMQLLGANWNIVTGQIKSWNGALAINWQKMIVNIARAGAKLPGPMGRHFKKIADDGQREINRLQGSLNKTNTKLAQSRVQALEIKLRHLGRQKPTPKVSANIRQAQAQIDRINAKLRGIPDQYVNVFVSEVNRDRATAGRARASGGPMLNVVGRTYLTGENGPEITRPKGQGSVMTAAATRNMMGMAARGGGGGGDTYIFNINAIGERQLGDAVVSAMASRTAGQKKIPRSAVA